MQDIFAGGAVCELVKIILAEVNAAGRAHAVDNSSIRFGYLILEGL